MRALLLNTQNIRHNAFFLYQKYGPCILQISSMPCAKMLLSSNSIICGIKNSNLYHGEQCLIISKPAKKRINRHKAHFTKAVVNVYRHLKFWRRRKLKRRRRHERRRPYPCAVRALSARRNAEMVWQSNESAVVAWRVLCAVSACESNLFESPLPVLLAIAKQAYVYQSAASARIFIAAAS